MKYLFFFLLICRGFFALASTDNTENDTLYNAYPFLIYFNESDTSMYFEDRSSNFHFYKKNTFLYDFETYDGFPAVPFVPELIYACSPIFFFTFHRVFSIHGIDSHSKYLFKYNRENKTFSYMPFSDHNDTDTFDYLTSVTSSRYKENFKIIRRRNKTYLKLVFYIYPLEKGKPKKIKKVYVEERLSENFYYKGTYFKLIFNKSKSRFEIGPYIY